jgi:hypothetical protein
MTKLVDIPTPPMTLPAPVEAPLTTPVTTTVVNAPLVAAIMPTMPAMTTTEAKTLTTAPVMPISRPRNFYIASMWHIESAEGVDCITAVNNNTGDKFAGTITEFNAMLKGN